MALWGFIPPLSPFSSHIKKPPALLQAAIAQAICFLVCRIEYWRVLPIPITKGTASVTKQPLFSVLGFSELLAFLLTQLARHGCFIRSTAARHSSAGFAIVIDSIHDLLKKHLHDRFPPFQVYMYYSKPLIGFFLFTRNPSFFLRILFLSQYNPISLPY